MIETQISAQLRQCPECKTPMVLTNGAVEGSVTVWMDGGQPCVTPHSEGCGLTGKPVPRMQWGVGPYKEEPDA